MHRDLEDWLNKVWRDRKDIFSGLQQTGRAIHAQPLDKHQGIGRVYDKYTQGTSTGGTTSSGTSKSADVPTFLKNLADLVDRKQAKCVIQDEIWADVDASDLIEIANGETLVFSWEPKNSDDPGMCKISLESIRWDFIHIRHETNFDREMDQRIYLNLAIQGRGKNFARIVETVYDHNGFRSAKVSSPDGPPRNDTALLYLADATAVEFALGKITEIQKQTPSAFLPGLPRLTSPVSGLTGVGRGMEPPSYAVIRQGGRYYKLHSGMSFGWWRSALIFMALDRTYWTRPGQDDNQRREAFKRRAAKYFRAAGIDPDNPSVQTNPDSLPEYPS